MATPYTFQISMPVDTTLPRDRMTNTVHLEHVTGGIDDGALEGMCSDIVAMYQTKYGNATHEVMCKAYDVGDVPNYPRATVVVNAGNPWSIGSPREVALCLSFSGPQRGNKNERGRIYLIPQLAPGGNVNAPRPGGTLLTWALEWYTKPNESFPDLGGVDWKFGVYSKTLRTFRSSTQAWVNDDWDVQRKRGLRESTRVSAQREG